MLVFIHIPKTAGTTLHKILVHQAGPGGVMVRHDADGAPTPGWLDEAASRDREGGLMVVGHQSVGLHQMLSGVRYVTCLRHPVARLLSHYQHARMDPAHYLHEIIHRENWDPARYVRSGISGELSDGMVRMLAGVEDFDHGRVDEDTLESAKQHIKDHFDAVIPSERFDSGVVMLAADQGWPPPYYIRRKVGKRPPTPLSAGQRAEIEACNRFDLALYQWALEHFDTLAAARPGLPAATAAFVRKNHLRGKMVFLMREATLRMKGIYR